MVGSFRVHTEDCLCHITIQEGHDLSASASCVGTESGGTCARCNIFAHGPLDSIRIIGIGVYINKIVGFADCWRLFIAVQEGHSLCAGTGCVRTESGGAGATGDALLHGPHYCVIVITVHRDIGEGTVGTRVGGTGSPPEEGHDLSTSAGIIWAECGSAGAGGNALLHSPSHGVIVIRIRLDISETEVVLDMNELYFTSTLLPGIVKVYLLSPASVTVICLPSLSVTATPPTL